MAPTRPQRMQVETSPDQLQLVSIASPSPEKALPKVPADMQRSQITKRKMGITQRQKQALIDNLQLEITERARRLRAGYNLQAQVLRSRIEVRLNRIPTALRKLTLGELLDRVAEQQRKPPAASALVRPPPVPEKDTPPRRQAPYKPGQVGYHYPAAAQSRGHKRLSDDMVGFDKENTPTGDIENPKKRVRTAGGGAVLSPASSNVRLPLARDQQARPPSPAKSFIARPISPVKPAPRGVLASLADDNNNYSSHKTPVAPTPAATGRSTRGTAAAKQQPTRKATTSSTTSSSAGSSSTATTAATAAAARGAGRRGVAASLAPPPPVPPTSAPSTARAGPGRPRKSSVARSETSEGSTSTVVRRGRAKQAPGVATTTTKRSVMSTIKKGVAGATAGVGVGRRAAAAKVEKTPAPKTAPTTTGRVLRKRT